MMDIEQLALPLLALAIFSVPLPVQAQGMAPTAQSLDTTITREVHTRYLLYLPSGYETSTSRWPLVLFLHGSGERGSDLSKVTVHGPPRLARDHNLPYILVVPQVAEGEVWSSDVLLALLDRLQSTLRVDNDRVYVTGLSMGGFGTWEVATADPHRFAAIAPISGGGNPVAACRVREVPTWIIHGEDDNVIPSSWSHVMNDWLTGCKGMATLTIYPGVGHDAWTQTYEDPAFWRWLLAQHRQPGAIVRPDSN
jgi:predicted peptidase